MKALLLLAAVIGCAHAGALNLNAEYVTAAGTGLKPNYLAGAGTPALTIAGSAVTGPAGANAVTDFNLRCAPGYVQTLPAAGATPQFLANVTATVGADWPATGPNWANLIFTCSGPSVAVSTLYAAPSNTTPFACALRPGFAATPAPTFIPMAVTCAISTTAAVAMNISCASGWNQTSPAAGSSPAPGSAAANAVAWAATGTDFAATVNPVITCINATPNSTTPVTNGTNSSNTSSNTTPAAPPGSAPVPAGSSAVVQATANAVAALGPNPPITSVINVLNNLPANTSSADFVSSTNVALATAYPTTGTALTGAQGTTFFEALPSTLTSNSRTITFTTSQINLIFQQIGISSRGQTAAVVANRGQCVSACVALAQLTGIRLFSKICATNACAGLRQVNGLPAVSCSGTAQQQRDCWKNAACAGQLNGVANCTVQNVAERCPSCDKSKKGLLGLLGLLGIIPLVLSSLLLSLLLLCIRRKKTAGAVQFATYDAGAQNVCVPGAPGFGPGYPATCL